MNPLERYPHLFANGMFDCQISDPHGDRYIVGINGDFADMLMDGDHNPSQCTLIARKIASMSDIECTESLLFECLKDKAEPEYIRRELIKMNSYTRTMRLSLYLLGIGVYPFDQSHFDSGNVIDVNSING